MDQATLVNSRIDDGARLIEILSRGTLEISAAFWLYAGEGDGWSLHIISPTVDLIGLIESYKAVIHALSTLEDVEIETDDVTLLRPGHPLAVAILDFMNQHPAPLVTRVWGAYLGGIFIDTAYLYPRKVSV